MKADRKQISTARGVALVRAIEMTRPEGERVSSDPYAEHFVSPLTVQFMRAVATLGINRLTGVEGLMNFAMAREQYIHELMARELRGGIEQMVILGAGFDTRAYRISEAAGVPVFEVDHPVTQVAKREALSGVVGPCPTTSASSASISTMTISASGCAPRATTRRSARCSSGKASSST